MRSGKPMGLSRPAALLGGVSFGALWYFGAQSVIGEAGLPLSVLPVVGAIACAAGIPACLLSPATSPVQDPYQGFDALSDEIYVVDRATSRLHHLNATATKRCRLSTGDQVWDAFPPSYHQVLRAVMEVGDTLDDKVFSLDGRSFLPSVRLLEGGKLLLQVRDITHDVAAQKVKEDFVSTVSHELRSPLTSIKGSMGLLLSTASGELPAPARRLIEVAHRNSERLTLILNDILDLQKIVDDGMAMEVQETNAVALIEEAVAASALIFQRFDLNIVVFGTEAPVWLRSDPNRIIQVLGNLLNNAAKFSKPGGQITIQIEELGDKVAISVRDEGVGIPVHDQHRIFERFADMSNSDRTKNGGSGLGLSICKAIIDKLDGKIEFESVEGEGTVFRFILPRLETEHGLAPIRDRVQSAG